MPRIDLDILNQKQTPAFYASSLATRPAAGFVGRIFIDSDSPSTGLYRDTGTVWVQIADPGAGTTGTLQQVTTNGNTTTIGIISNTLSTPLWNTVNSDSPYYFGSTTVNDFFKIFNSIGSTLDQTEMVFQVGDNGQPYASGGERFRFNYDNSGGGIAAKDVFIVDYNLSYFNTNLGINTATPGSPLDIHTGTGINATFNGTGTTNSILQFQLAGIGKWNIGNLYNASANDFIIRDVTNAINRITVKNTGQTFIGNDTTSSGLLVVNSSTSDNHIVAIGANAPSLRLRDSGSGGVLSCGLGISTATNNFIQGSESGNYCIFNSSTTASPILFGIYDAGTSNTQEAARISAARNFLVGTSTDSGQKLQINGTSVFSGTATFSQDIGWGGVTPTGNAGISNTIESSQGAQIAARQGVPQFYISSNVSGTPYAPTRKVSGYAAQLSLDGFGGTISLNRAVTSTAGSAITWINNLAFDNTGAAYFSGAIAIANTVTAAVSVASTHKVSILIGGVQYYLLASNV